MLDALSMWSNKHHARIGKMNVRAAWWWIWKRKPVAATQIVRAGERYRHLFPNVTEPDVNGRVEILHEDEALIVMNKPAPLPMHAGGRFYRTHSATSFASSTIPKGRIRRIGSTPTPQELFWSRARSISRGGCFRSGVRRGPGGAESGDGCEPTCRSAGPTRRSHRCAQVVTAYYTVEPDPDNVDKQVVFGTSGHRGSSLDAAFNEAHILRPRMAIVEYRAEQGTAGPLFIGRDTHALSSRRWRRRWRCWPPMMLSR